MLLNFKLRNVLPTSSYGETRWGGGNLSSNLFKVGVYLGEVAFAQVPDLFLLLLGHDLTPVLEVVLVEDLKWNNKDG